MAEFFGYEFKKKDKTDQLPTFAPSVSDLDQSVTSIDASAIVGSAYGTALSIDETAKTEADLVIKYRNMVANPEMDSAVESISNEAIVYSQTNKTVQIVLDDIDTMSDGLKNTINDEFNRVLDLLDFNNRGFNIFRQWYVDGRIYYHAVVDPKNLSDGIQQLRPIDPTKLRKVRQKANSAVQPVLANNTKMPATKEYYIYNDKGFGQAATMQNNWNLPSNDIQTTVAIAKDSIVFATSGLTDATGRFVLSYLHKAIKPLNCLSMLEDASIIYRLVRAPERRIFNVDVGNLPKMKAEQYLREVASKYKNRLVYDATTGEVKDDRKFMTMQEDFWMPKRGDGKGTTIDVLQGGQNLGEMGEVEYFQKKLYNALNLPTSRLDQSNNIFASNTTQINRDEMEFFKFIIKLRARFSTLLLSALEKQVVLKNILTIDEWNEIKQRIRFDYYSENNFNEIRNLEMLNLRFAALQAADPFVGKYLSQEYVFKNILQLADEDIETMRMQMQSEIAQGFVTDPLAPPQNNFGS